VFDNADDHVLNVLRKASAMNKTTWQTVEKDAEVGSEVTNWGWILRGLGTDGDNDKYSGNSVGTGSEFIICGLDMGINSGHSQ